MSLSRRQTLALALGAAAAAAIPLPALARIEEAVAAFTGGAAVSEGDIRLTAPEIAENGNAVPVEDAAPGATAILLLATANPETGLCLARFGEASGSSMFATRIRLAQTQDIVAIAQMADGSFRRTRAEVKVTIGGCGG